MTNHETLFTSTASIVISTTDKMAEAISKIEATSRTINSSNLTVTAITALALKNVITSTHLRIINLPGELDFVAVELLNGLSFSSLKLGK